MLATFSGRFARILRGGTWEEVDATTVQSRLHFLGGRSRRTEEGSLQAVSGLKGDAFDHRGADAQIIQIAC